MTTRTYILSVIRMCHIKYIMIIIYELDSIIVCHHNKDLNELLDSEHSKKSTKKYKLLLKDQSKNTFFQPNCISLKPEK